MRIEGSVLFRSRGEFTEAVLAAIAASTRELTLADRDFADWPIDGAAGCQALAAFLAGDPQSRLRLLVADPEPLERRGARFVALRRRHAGSVECRRIPPSLFNGEGVAIGDRRHLLRRAHGDFFRGRLTLADAAAAEPTAHRYDLLWEESTPCLAANTLGL
jgi:hypothetical protein